MGTTPKLALPYPEEGSPADVPVDIKALADKLEAVLNGGTSAEIAGVPTGTVIFNVRNAHFGRWLRLDGTDRTQAEIEAALGLTAGGAADFATLMGTGGTSRYGAAATGKIRLPDVRRSMPLAAGPATDGPGGLSDRALGSTGGAETHTLSAAESGLPSHTHAASQAVHNHAITDPGHSHGTTVGAAGGHDHGGATAADGNHNHTGNTGSVPAHNHGGSTAAEGAHTHSNGTLATAAAGAHDHGGSTGETSTGTQGSFATLTNTATGGAGTRVTDIADVSPADHYGNPFLTADLGHSHSISMSANHSHTVTGSTGAVVGTHSHTITNDNAHSHTIPNSGNHTHVIAAEGNHTHTVSVGSASTGITLADATPAVTVTNVAAAPASSAHENMPPFVTVGYAFIRV